MRDYETDYKQLIRDTLANGEPTTDRTGAGAIEQLGVRFHIPHSPHLPILTGRKIFYKGVLGELAAFLQGADTVAQFKAQGCNYWDAWADENGQLGPIYGVNWIKNSQLARVMSKARVSADSRQLIVDAWDPGTLSEMALPPCHFAFQLLIRSGCVNIVIYQRSLDIMVGLPSDVILYKVLQKLIAQELGLEPGDLTFMLGSAHIYKNHAAAVAEYLTRPQHAPRNSWGLAPQATTTNFLPNMFHLAQYEYEPPLTNPLALNV